MMIKDKHCCNLMKEVLEEDKVTIGYSSKFRSYYLNLKCQETSSQDIYYCPWCGRKLPEILDENYDLELSRVLNIPVDEITYNTYNKIDLSPEFKTNEWWKKRGL